MKLFLITMITIILSACGVSPEEKEMRRANAFDISGSYAISDSDKNQITSFNIINESDRSNIFIQLARNNFTREEEAAFDRQKISLNDVEILRRNLTIGKGRPFDLSGGENISTDFGKSTKVFVSTNNNERVKIGNFSVNYSFQGSILKNSDTISGKLSLSITETIQENNKFTIYFRETIDMPVTLKNNSASQSQYFGSWSGSIQSNEDILKQVFQKISIEKLSDNFYTVKPARDTFYLNGEKFVFNAKSFNIKNLSNATPSISVSFIGENKNQIQLTANIYALGMLMGTITKIESNENEALGQIHFRLN